MPRTSMSNSAYGKRVRERELFNRRAARRILGQDGVLHGMNIRRKAGHGIGRFADITKPLPASAVGFIRERLRRATKEAVQREFIGFLSCVEIRQRINATAPKAMVAGAGR